MFFSFFAHLCFLSLTPLFPFPFFPPFLGHETKHARHQTPTSNTNIKQIVNLFNRIQQAAVNIINGFTSAIEAIRNAILGLDGCNFLCQFDKLKDQIVDLPNTVEKLAVTLTSMTKRLNDTDHPIVNPQLRKMLEAFNSVFGEAYNDIHRMYALAFDTITVTIPELAKNVTSTVGRIVEAIKALPRCPNAAAYALLDAKDKIQGYIALIFVLKGEFEDAFYIRSRQLPSWLHPTKELKMVIAQLPTFLINHFKIMAWDCDAATPAKPDMCNTLRAYFDEAKELNSMLSNLKPVADVLAFVQDTVKPQIDTAVRIYTSVRTAYETIKAT